jgi:hypothetical protein
VLPRLLLRVRRAFKILPFEVEPQDPDIEGRTNTAQWHQMLADIRSRSPDTERRLRQAEAALNRLTLN